MAKKKVLNHEVLPADLVEEILLYLPVKSVLRFSSVSKTWISIISESRFVKRYSGCSGREKNIVISLGHASSMFEHERLVNFTPSYNVSSVSSMASSSGPGVEASSTGLVVSEFGDNTQLLALCDELWLACLPDKKSFFLWNPSTRRHKKLPNPSIMVNQDLVYDPGYFVIGLGYDSVGDDYKILKIPGLLRLDNCDRGELYSLRSDSWRDVPNVPEDIRCDSLGVFLSGKIHWLSMKFARCGMITSFDLSMEKFGEVVGPPLDISTTMKFFELIPSSTNGRNEVRMLMYISVLRGMLCASLTDVVDENCDIWMMEEYGVATSWTLKFTIKKLGPIYRILPLCVLENGAILVKGFCRGQHKFKVYVHQDGKSRLQQLSYGSSSRHFCRITDVSPDSYINIGIVYADSLVAPDAFV